MPGAALDKSDLFARLARGHAAKVSVVTPNPRLAKELAREFDAHQVAQGLKVWEAADILPLGAFLERLWDDALHADVGEKLSTLLSPTEEQHLWEESIRATERGRGLVAPALAAAQCRDAWRLMHAWHIDAVGGTEDADAFVEWSRAYAKQAGGEIDGARLPDLAAKLAEARKPAILVAYAFDILPPQTREFFAACARTGVEVRSCGPQLHDATPVRAAFPGAREELEAAAQWARARLESKAGRIGVVIPDLQLRRKEVARVFTRVMGSPQPFNISLGVALDDYPLVHAALGILDLAHGEVGFAAASRLVRSPFLGWAETEMSRRAMLDASLRRTLPATLTLAKLVGAVERCPLLRERLEALFAVAQSLPSPARGRGVGGRGGEFGLHTVRPPSGGLVQQAARTAGEGSPHEWARHFTALLGAAGFPGERALDSAEFQAHAKWNETLADLAKLERVAAKMSRAQALAKLRRMCAEALFQPESPDAPVQVLGILESAGLEFDCLWVAGLSDEAWPLSARPNPFISIALQRKAGVPEATAESAYELDRRITGHWFIAAREVIVSHPLREQDRELSPSPLIAAVAEGSVDVPAFPRFRDLLFAARTREAIPDGKAPPLIPSPPAPLPGGARGASTSPLPLAGEGSGVRVRGGTRVLADQSACPFRAFARHRLGARALEEPVDGLDAAARGTLLHELMARLWRELKGSDALDTDVGPAIERAAAGAVAELEIEGRFAALEQKRLEKLAREWLAIERERGPFTVAAVEDARDLAIGGLEISGRIDRMDRLEDGTHALIDYKTGKVTRQDWIGERPLDPQLPLYAVTAKEEVSAIAFARLKTGDMKFTGYGAGDGFVEQATDWGGLRRGWWTELESIACSFAAGAARVDPKGSLKTCRLCDLQPLCRVHEKLALLEDEGDEE